jgi:predicted DNA-binding transcriptional regulator AlpA
MTQNAIDEGLKLSEVARLFGRSRKWVMIHLSDYFPNAFQLPHAGRIGGFDWRIPQSDVDALNAKIRKGLQ